MHDAAEFERVCQRLPDNAMRAALSTPVFQPVDITHSLDAVMAHRNETRRYEPFATPMEAEALRGSPGLASGCLLPARCADMVTSIRIRKFRNFDFDRCTIVFECIYPNVSELTISSNSLLVVYDHVSPSSFFNRLRVLEVVDCRQLKRVFGFIGERRQMMLTKLVVRACPELEEMEPILYRCTLLTHLDLSKSGIVTLPSSIGHCRCLVTLIAAFCPYLRKIEDRIGECERLETVNVSHCEQLMFADTLCDCVRLKRLDISYTDVRAIPTRIGKCAALETLDIRYTPITAIPEIIGDCVELQDLTICPQLTVGRPEMSLPERIGDCAKLSTLVVNNFNFAALPLTAIPERIGDCQSLQCITMKYVAITTLPSRIGDCANLITIHVSNNPSFISLPDRIGDCAELRNLVVISCPHFAELQSRIGECKKLEKLILNHTGVRRLPESLAECESLSLIDLTSCEQIEGLPAGLAQRGSERMCVLGISDQMRFGP